jgi:hypothetical protein
MTNRNPWAFMPVLLLAFPIAGLASSFDQATADQRDASAVLKSIQESIVKNSPTKVRLIASGSGYLAPTTDRIRQHFKIDTYTQELDLTSHTLSEQVVPASATDAASPSPLTTHTAGADSTWRTQFAFWTTPLGFLAGAAGGRPTLTDETLEGAKYRVISFTPPGGQPVRGYINEQNVLERTRTTVQDGAQGKVDVEAIYWYWTDFNGVKLPSMIIEKQNGELSRVLVVNKVEVGRGSTS